jgi:hypothetical protein
MFDSEIKREIAAVADHGPDAIHPQAAAHFPLVFGIGNTAGRD